MFPLSIHTNKETLTKYFHNKLKKTTKTKTLTKKEIKFLFQVSDFS